MGRKGVSKRKTSKSKTPTISNGGGKGSVSSIARVSETPTARQNAGGDAISTGKGGKKK